MFHHEKYCIDLDLIKIIMVLNTAKAPIRSGFLK